MTNFICGHKIPDLDSIIASISLAHLKQALNENAVAVRQGDINPETAFVLEKFGLKTPEFKANFAGENLYLVDHCDLAQAPDDIKDANLKGIVDHHKLGDVTSNAPLECWIRPVGSSNTVIKQMFDYYGVEIPANIAAAMLCAILSDTVIFKSPTCTKEDTKAAKELAKTSQIDDIRALGMELFNVKSNISGASARELLMRDYKDFDMNGKKIGIGQLEVVDLNVFNSIKPDLKKELKLQNEGRYATILLLTDILQNGSLVLIESQKLDEFEEAFKVKFENNEAWYDKCMSRKKQVVPPLESIFS